MQLNNNKKPSNATPFPQSSRDNSIVFFKCVFHGPFNFSLFYVAPLITAHMFKFYIKQYISTRVVTSSSVLHFQSKVQTVYIYKPSSIHLSTYPSTVHISIYSASYSSFIYLSIHPLIDQLVHSFIHHLPIYLPSIHPSNISQ